MEDLQKETTETQKSSSEVSQLSDSTDTPISIAKLRHCLICWQEFESDSDFHAFKNCDHYYCRSCVRTHLEVKIFGGFVGELQCMSPGCEARIEDNELRELLDPETYEKYQKLAANAALQEDPNCRWCPSCNKAGIYPPESWARYPEVTCSHCFSALCANCRTTWHADQTCAERKLSPDEEEVRRWAEEHFAEKCPKCGCWAQKLHGCDYVKCISCKHQFCFACLEPHDHSIRHVHGPKYNPEKERRYEKAWAKRHPKQRVAGVLGFGVVVVIIVAVMVAISPLWFIAETVRKNKNKNKSTTSTSATTPAVTGTEVEKKKEEKKPKKLKNGKR